jgi:hypothetical protein
MSGHFTTLWKLWSTSTLNCGVLVLCQDSWHERLLGTSTKLGLKVFNTNLSGNIC